MVRFYLVGVIPQIIDRQEMSDWSIFATKKALLKKGAQQSKVCYIREEIYHQIYIVVPILIIKI
jgi:hypothetical protein